MRSFARARDGAERGLRGLPYMTSTVGGGGSPKSRQEEQNQLICDSDSGVKNSDNFAGVIYGSPLRHQEPIICEEDQRRESLCQSLRSPKWTDGF